MTHKRKVTIPDDYPNQVFCLRRRFRLTQAQFADHLGVTENSIGGWENGTARPSRTAWCRLLRLSNGISPPRDDPQVKIIPDWLDRPIRINITRIASYRQARETDFNQKPAYELFEYTVVNMVGGHIHNVHMCAVEFDNMFGADARHYR